MSRRGPEGHYTRKQLAAEAGVHRTTFGRWITAGYVPPPDVRSLSGQVYFSPARAAEVLALIAAQWAPDSDGAA